MTNTLSATAKAAISWAMSEASGNVSQADSGEREWTHDFVDGSGSFEANVRFQDRRTLAASASETLDFQSLTQEYLDASGPVSFDAIKLLVIINLGTQTSQTLDVTTAGLSNPIDDILLNSGAIRIHYGEPWIISSKVSGWAVTASVKELKFTNNDGSNSLTYDILTLGV